VVLVRTFARWGSDENGTELDDLATVQHESPRHISLKGSRGRAQDLAQVLVAQATNANLLSNIGGAVTGFSSPLARKSPKMTVLGGSPSSSLTPKTQRKTLRKTPKAPVSSTHQGISSMQLPSLNEISYFGALACSNKQELIANGLHRKDCLVGCKED
jgi:hypothetical protein